MQKYIEDIKKIIFKAGEIMLGSHLKSSDIASKPGDANFVTEYDVAVQEFLIEKFSALIPEAGFFSEEKDNGDVKSKISENEIYFIIDPIDGTTNFIHGYNHSAISVALCKGKKAVFGAVLNPYSGEMFSAYENQGAEIQKENIVTKINVSERGLCDALVSFGTSPYKKHLADETFEIVKKLYLQCRDIRRSGSAALDICYVAAGRTDLFFEATLSPWDYAAGSIILREAGGIITQLDGSEINLLKPSSILAANKPSHQDFLK